MTNKIKLLRGQLPDLILYILKNGDKYGYEILNEVEKLFDKKLTIKQPSLYSSLSRMEKQELVSSYWRDGDLGGKRHYYSLTNSGKKQLEKFKINNLCPINQIQSDKDSQKPLKTKVINLETNKENSNKQIIDIKKEFDLLKSTNASFVENIKSEKPQKNIFEKTNVKNIKILTKENVNATEKNLNFLIESNELNSTPSDAEVRFKDLKKQEYIKSKSNDAHFEKSENLNHITNLDSIKKDEKQTNSNSIENEKTQKNLLKIKEVEEVENDVKLENRVKNIDSGSFITEKYSSENMPRVKKISPIRISKIKNNKIIDIKKSDIEYGFTEKINELYNKSKKVDEKVFVQQNSNNVQTLDELKNYYDNINLKFSTYINPNIGKNNYRTNLKDDNKKLKKNFKKPYYNKSYLKKFIILFLAITLESAFIYFIFNFLKLKIDYPFLYLILPLIFLIISIYYYILTIKNKINLIPKFKTVSIWLKFLIILIGIVLIYSINILLGMTFENILEFSTTFLYPSLLLLNVLLNYMLNLIYFRKNQNEFYLN